MTAGNFKDIYRHSLNIYRSYNDPTKVRPLYNGEYHLLNANFEGPGTRIDLKKVREFPPYNNVDAQAKKHDLAYYKASFLPTYEERSEAVREADKQFLKDIEPYKNEEPYYTAGKKGIEGKIRFENLLPILTRYGTNPRTGKPE